LTSLREAGVKEVVIVVGYRAEQIEAKLKAYEDTIGVSARVVYNPFFSSTNNLVSLWMARGEMGEDFTIINGDVVFGQEVMAGLLKESVDRNICMVVDEKLEYDEEDMKVILRKSQVADIGKDIACGEANGESIGMIKVGGAGREMLCRTLDAMIRKEETKSVFYLEAFRLLARTGWPIHAHIIRADQWAEVDFHSDLHLVQDALRQRGKGLLAQVGGLEVKEG
jgi:L-glutamine-phosphate cytidylyltransferase